MTQLNEKDVITAQNAWARGIISIGAAPSWEESHRLAVALAKDLYLLDGSLLFCPTKAAQRQFRATLGDVVSYFVGRDDRNPEDQGFALTTLTTIRFENTGIVCGDDYAMAMGNYFFVQPGGDELKAEFSFVYRLDEEARMKIQLHHSSLPYSG